MQTLAQKGSVFTYGYGEGEERPDDLGTTR
jgi:hypothetical protein